MKNEKALIFFFKYPETGNVKTRLAEILGKDFVYELYTNFLRDIFSIYRNVNAEMIICYSSDKETIKKDFLWDEAILSFKQAGSGLGERMYNSFNSVFSMGFKKCLLMGSDSPDLPIEFVERAFNELDNSDITLGPTRDGGYYLIGINKGKIRKSIFEGINWSTGTVLVETISCIEKEELSLSLLDTWYDIDELEDLKFFYNRNLYEHKKSYTMSFLLGKKSFELFAGF